MATQDQAGSSKPPLELVKLGPLKRYRGMTWVGWVNVVIFQWLFLRLAYRTEDDNSISGWGFCFALPFWGRVLTKCWIWPRLPPGPKPPSIRRQPSDGLVWPRAPRPTFDYKTSDGPERRELRSSDEVLSDSTRVRR